jgi:hypothetical protein
VVHRFRKPLVGVVLDERIHERERRIRGMTKRSGNILSRRRMSGVESIAASSAPSAPGKMSCGISVSRGDGSPSFSGEPCWIQA